jgi:hypothetical protein
MTAAWGLVVSRSGFCWRGCAAAGIPDEER